MAMQEEERTFSWIGGFKGFAKRKGKFASRQFHCHSCFKLLIYCILQLKFKPNETR
jgi:hypothetical protein